MATPLTKAEWLDECAKLAKTYEEAMTDEAKGLVERLREMGEHPCRSELPMGEDLGEDLRQAADRIEQLEREKAVVSDLWEQQKEIALGYLADCNKAADLIETQAREIERLREALIEYVYETTHLSPQEEDGSHWCKISANCLSKARAALAKRGLQVTEIER